MIIKITKCMRKSIILILFSLTMCLSVLNCIISNYIIVKADTVNNKIENPRVVTDGTVTWDKIQFGSYYQDMDEMVKRPIKWRILSINGNDAFLMSDEALDCKPFNDKGVEKINNDGEKYIDYSCTWKTCTLRKWLNDMDDSSSFINTAFSDEERVSILDTNVINEDDDNTSDKVYLLSVAEVSENKYGFEPDVMNSFSKTREAKVTDYAYMKMNGDYRNHDSEYCRNCYWWLRSSGSNNSIAVHIGYEGWAEDYEHSVNVNCDAVRPVMHVDLSSVSIKDAGKIKSTGDIIEPDSADYISDGYVEPTIEDDVTTWDCVYFGNYIQNATFEKKPIEWRVLSVDGDDGFLLANNILDCKPYNNSYGNVTWETCTLRKWLNDTNDNSSFINTAFTTKEKFAIIETSVTNSNNIFYNTEGGNDTIDKVFLLSTEEASMEAYGFDMSFGAYSDTRKSYNTDYAYLNGSDKYIYDGRRVNGWWWQRSPGGSNDYATYVSTDGIGNIYGTDNYSYGFGVRPAIHIDLSKAEYKVVGTISSNSDLITNDNNILTTEEYKYKINNDGKTITIIEYLGKGGIVEIPSNIQGKMVTIIDTGCFKDNETITWLTIPETITEIDENAFYNCQNLGSLQVLSDNLLTYFTQERVDAISHNIKIYNSERNIHIESTASISEDGNYKIAPYKDNIIIVKYLGGDTDITIPSIIDGKTVIAIGKSAFSGIADGTATANEQCAHIKKVIIPNTVKEIYPYAFDFLFELKEVDIVDGLEYIGDYAFSWTSLEIINMPSTLKYIGKGAFALTHVKEFILPEGLEYLGDEAFNDNSYLEKIWIPASLESGVMFGSRNTSLKQINVADDNEAYKSVDGVLYSKDMKTLLIYPQMHGKAFSIPVGVETISENAFITRAYYNGSGEYDYEYTNSLENLEIPYTVNNIQMEALKKCGSLKSISVDSNNSMYKSCDGVLYSKDESVLYVYPQSKEGDNYKVLSNTNIIADSAFNMNKSLKNIVLPQGLKKIDNKAFYHCRYLVNITVYDSVKAIGEEVFELTPDYDYSSIKTLTINCNENSFAYNYAKENNYFVDSIKDTNNDDVNNSSNYSDLGKDTNSNNNIVEHKVTSEQDFVSDKSLEQIVEEKIATPPQKVKLLYAKNKKEKSIVVKWKNIKNVKGFEMQYAMNKKFTKNKKTKTTSNLTLTVKKLKKGKTYYVRVRAYNLDSKGSKVYGKWSSAKKVKIKK